MTAASGTRAASTNDEPFATGPLGRALTAAALLAAMTAWLALMGRPLFCACGSVRFWQAASAGPGGDSQQFADWYSLLHVVFGIGLFVFTDTLRPNWRIGGQLTAVLLGHSIWEAIENTPFVIALFSSAAQTAGYDGDTILNSFGDTLFAIAGALLAWRLPLTVTAALAVGLDVVVSLAIGDGLVLGALRILGAPV